MPYPYNSLQEVQDEINVFVIPNGARRISGSHMNDVLNGLVQFVSSSGVDLSRYLITSSFNTFTSSYNVASASFDTRIRNTVSGSNNYIGKISGSSVINSTIYQSQSSIIVNGTSSVNPAASSGYNLQVSGSTYLKGALYISGSDGSFYNNGLTTSIIGSLSIGTDNTPTTVNIYGILNNGTGSIASGIYSHAEGWNTTASGAYSHAEGRGSRASETGSHAEGTNTIASSSYSHAEGQGTIALGIVSHAEGLNTITSGSYSHAEGQSTIALALASHAEGQSTISSGIGAHAEGLSTIATGSWSHAEGQNTIASSSYSHAEGLFSRTEANGAHAEGAYTTASGIGSHAEGHSTIAYGSASHAEGLGTIASGSFQSVLGKYNLKWNSGSFVVIGNGTSDTSRSDLISFNPDNIQISGSLLVSGSTIFTGTVKGAQAVVSDEFVTLAQLNAISGSSGTGSAGDWYRIISGSTTVTSYSNGRVIIASGSTNSARLIVSGSGSFTGEVDAPSFNQTSLKILKENIFPFSASAVDIIKNIEVVSFNYKTNTGTFKIGVIADDTHEYVSSKNHNVMDTTNSIGLLFKAIQELNEKIDALGK